MSNFKNQHALLRIFVLTTITILLNQKWAECVTKRRLTRTLLPLTGDENTNGRGSALKVSAPLMSEDINLETIEGVDEVTKLVLLKTDSLPSESEEKIDGRYLNNLMETLYTGLRKPFKSVSADILGIFPSFEEVQVRCERPSMPTFKSSSSIGGQANSRGHHGNLERDESLLNGGGIVAMPQQQRRQGEQRRRRRQQPAIDESVLASGINQSSSAELLLAADNTNTNNNNFKSSSMQVCEAVTNDCLSMEDLVAMLPPSITTFDAALVRLCPVMLFRIMNQLCNKPSDSLYRRQLEPPGVTEEAPMQESDNSQQQQQQQQQVANSIGSSTANTTNNSSTISLSTLQILRNLQNSDVDPISGSAPKNRPQKLHKKLKTQTNKNGRLVVGGKSNMNNIIHQQYGVDEQLLKIRLKLSEPSIEKVWIFSLLFVILSIVVSMGGLIVLPFVKKTTRRRILTLFEGLAVGGLAGSATLHMFPQAFGLVDENYHKYFWRIFVVFFGIYLCYLCERIIKILKVVRARRRRRSRASLIEHEAQKGKRGNNLLTLAGAYVLGLLRVPAQKVVAQTSHCLDFFRSVNIRSPVGNDSDLNMDAEEPTFEWTKRLAEIKDEEAEATASSADVGERQRRSERKKFIVRFARQADRSAIKKSPDDERWKAFLASNESADDEELRRRPSVAFSDEVEEPDCEVTLEMLAKSNIGLDNSAQRQRLIKCLKSVQHQFSPVYAVYSSNSENRFLSETDALGDGGGRHRSSQHKKYNKKRHSSGRGFHKSSGESESERRPSFWKQNVLFERWQAHAEASKMRRQMKQREIETMLYHKHRMEQQLRLQQLFEEQQRRARRKQLRRQRKAAQLAAQLQERSATASPERRASLGGSSILSILNARQHNLDARLEPLEPVALVEHKSDDRFTPSTVESVAATVRANRRGSSYSDASRFDGFTNSSGRTKPGTGETAKTMVMSDNANKNGINNANTNANSANTNVSNNKNKATYMQRLTNVNDVAGERHDQDNAARVSVDTVAWMIVFGDAVLNVIDGLSIGAAFERNILAGISISVAVMLEEVTHRLGTFAVLIRAGMSMQQSLLCTFLSACALFPGLIVGILLSDATEDATPYIFCAAGGIFLYMALVDVMKEMNRSIENAIRKDIKSTLQIFALQNVGIVLAVIFLSFLALYEQAMDFEEYQMQYNQPL